MAETYPNPLQTILSEFKTISPDIINAFVAKNDGELVAMTESTTKDLAKKLVDQLNRINEQAELIGGIENITIEGDKNKLDITSLNNLYLATLYPNSANQKIVGSLTHVVVPTVAGLMNQLVPAENEPARPMTLEERAIPKTEVTEEKISTPPILQSGTQLEELLSKTPTNQFMVQKIVGVLVPIDTVRIDPQVLAKWEDYYVGQTIRQVHIETLEGKKVTCKLRASKEARGSTGIIQVPEKILQTLGTDAGKLVIVKPVIDE